jgi:hypothetical protein
MGRIVCPETSVTNYHHSLRNNPEERISQLLCGGSLKLAVTAVCLLTTELHLDFTGVVMNHTVTLPQCV